MSSEFIMLCMAQIANSKTITGWYSNTKPLGVEVAHKTEAMGTLVETDTVKEALDLVEKSAAVLQINSERIYSTIKLDIKKDASNMMVEKVKSVENKLSGGQK